MYKRSLQKIIYETSKYFPVLLLTGPRQVGKTTLLETCSTSDYNYVTLDDLDIRQLAKNDPALFIKTYNTPLIIDEVQYAPELFNYIKIKVDKERKNGMFWLTGSQKFHLMKGITESLAGRVAIIDLLGLSQPEIDNRSENNIPFLPTQEYIEASHENKLKNLQKVYQQIFLGSFPKISHISQMQNRERFYSSYIQTYLNRDIKDILNIKDQESFYNFLVATAARTGQLLNYTSLARDIGVDNTTIKSWISVLEASGLLYILRPYYRNITKRVIKTPKLYFLDTGLATYLTKWSSPETLAQGIMSGAIFETYCFIEILKSYWHNGKEAHFYYYRDKDGKEVDLLIEADNTLYPIEFKKTAMPSKHSIKNFNVLHKLDKKIGNGAILCMTDIHIPITENITAIPIHYL